jgi:hypothetical protein
MNTQVKFIVKILFFSTIISIAIKYGGQLLPIQPTNTIALVLVLLPPSILAILLLKSAKLSA